jgi:hypothetical protein
MHIFGNENADHHFEKGIFVHKGIIQAVKREELINDMMYITLRGRWCDFIFLNVHKSNENKVMT